MTDETAFIQKYGNILGRGKTALICGTDDVVAKIYVEGFAKQEIFHEAYLMAQVEQSDLPVPKVYGIEQCGSRYVLKMGRAKGRSLGELLLTGEITPEACMDILTPLQVQMHQIQIPETFLPMKKSTLYTNIRYNPLLTDAEKEELLNLLGTLPDGHSLCHGDFHAGNVQSDGENYSILDWAEVSSGPAASDACRTYLDYKYLGKYLMPEELAERMAELFLEKYTAASGISRDEIFAWLPITAAGLYGFVQDKEMNQELRSVVLARGTQG
ncbi:phosphotransferase family protein [Methanocorpusculum vombati]|uniref:Aminoglycoside phosphotransferase family protein n=1 Tax=Methanocorpusculum vombati TaxID=3002864 RepID=A0ABT4IJF9_9EURY|nr:aminoglycoside phosphotransferase family protein [Methanocorpusculum vombati]MCZ9320143.1 aminoglycoside phosphotransferase family protein [Methanocorpusculum sp.]MCZ0861879.1 aminoglycoside phosphotransferase family protein [Methanocorpusculum vombati]MDE2521151.1 aminoglycoside phosphotransferase family protein [Methanocorpusculum sp.]MDE2534888.1 aminoglycoside phosphotransferase family protein [Methanocorpusculum sp.]MDE2546246.1 aminoglycoside phosphotransferase family protein [Methano